MRNAPQVLCIQLLHFDANGQKINQEVDYPPELTVPNYQDGSETSTTFHQLLYMKGTKYRGGIMFAMSTEAGDGFIQVTPLLKKRPS